MAALIVGVHDKPEVRERLGDTPVAGRVLGHAVHDVNDRLGRGVAVGGEDVDEDGLAIVRDPFERGGAHASGRLYNWWGPVWKAEGAGAVHAGKKRKDPLRGGRIPATGSP